ncbi:IS630 family transposase [Acaryochloris marina]|uniref:IS630 family transposase n=1 Tax=Acaryochloris marina TaxID=155978 RepID=UPI001BAE984F|nr:IS630 family transposase [Acaryochloris marina]QUY45822.1 IS630 family transposase [Acaryochloris marina S15]
MSIVRPISTESLRLLHRIYRCSRHHQVRQRAHCLILSAQGGSPYTLASLFSVSPKTVYNWLKAWNNRGFAGLYNRPGRGRKPMFNPDQQQQIYEWTQASPIQLNRVLAQIEQQWSVRVSKATVKRVLKQMDMSWHRFRQGTSGQPLYADYLGKKQQLEHLKKQEEKGDIHLFFMDESGFSLVPCIPYGWQPIGTYLEIPTRSSKRLNVLGFLSRRQGLHAYTSEQTITSEVVSHCIDTFFTDVELPTVIVMDQAPIHTSQAIYEMKAEWAERGITLFELPSYSPHLNLIERLWQFMKYQWIEMSAYWGWSSLVEYVERVLKTYGDDYVINFS